MSDDVYTVVTIYGELVGRVASGLTDQQIEDQGFIELKTALKVTTVQDKNGNMMNAMIPVAQTMQLDTMIIPMFHIITFSPTFSPVATKYLEMTSGIALPPATNRLVVPG